MIWGLVVTQHSFASFFDKMAEQSEGKIDLRIKIAMIMKS
jgi:hypothetical protein